jgi:hypothetical protein
MWTRQRREGKSLIRKNKLSWLASPPGTVLVTRSSQSWKAPLREGLAVASEGNRSCCASLQLASVENGGLHVGFDREAVFLHEGWSRPIICR